MGFKTAGNPNVKQLKNGNELENVIHLVPKRIWKYVY